MTDPRPGQSSRDPLKLCQCLRVLYLDLIEQAKAEDISCVLIETLRDAERQQYYIDEGVSWTKRSKHLPQPPSGLSLAFDLAPKDYLKHKLWLPGGPLWLRLGEIGQDLGLRWGGAWRLTPDYAHFELRVCQCA